MRSLSAICPFLIVAATAAAARAQDPPPQQPPATGPTIVVPGVRKLTVSGQYRLRYEGQFNYDFDDDAGATTNDFFAQRVRVGLEFDFNDDLRAFIQFQDAREWGEETTTVDDAADGFDLHQGHVDLLHNPVLGGFTRVGRQELNIGDQRLVGALDWRNGGRSLDGILQRYELDESQRLQLWGFQTRELVNNNTNDDQMLIGADTSGKLMGADAADFYVIWQHDDGTAPGLTHNRVTLGTRWVWSSDDLEFGTELATQTGERNGADVPILDTWAGHVHATWKLGGDWKSAVRFELNAASGNDPGTADNERFDNVLPTAHAHWGMMDLALWENMVNPMVQFSIAPGAADTVTLAGHMFWSMEETDSFGGPNGQLTPGAPGSSNDMGAEIDLLWTRELALAAQVKTQLQVGYGLFLPGDGTQQAKGSDDPAHFFYVQFNLKF